MDCAKARGLISPYLDGELAAAARRELASHLRGCPDCCRLEAAWREQRQLFAQEESLVAPAGFQARVLARLTPDPAPVAGFGWLRLLAGVAEVAVLAVIIISGIVSGGYLVERLQPRGGMTAALALDLFEPAPPDSLGGVYLAMLEVADAR